VSCCVMPKHRRVVLTQHQGTVYFMPIEIQLNAVLPKNTYDDDDDDDDGPPIILDVIHNYAHDCESYWWLILWLLVERIPGQSTADFVWKVFQNSITPSVFRYNTFRDGDTLANLKAKPLHDAVRPLIKDLQKARRELVNNHQTRSRDKKKSRWDARSKYTVAFGAVRTLVKSVEEVAEAAPLESELRNLKTYRKEVPQEDVHRSAQAQAMTSGKGEESSSGSLIPPQRGHKRRRSDDSVSEEKRLAKVRSITRASSPGREVQNPVPSRDLTA
jgi:hypothetical protein